MKFATAACLLTLVCVTALVACNTETGPTEEELAAQKLEEKLDAALADLKTYKRNNPTDYAGIVSRARKIEDMDPNSGQAVSAASIREQNESLLETTAVEKFRETDERVKKLIATGDYETARAEIQRFPVQYRVGEVNRKIDKRMNQLRDLAAAKQNADQLMKGAAKLAKSGKYGEAIAELEKFDPSEFGNVAALVDLLEKKKAEYRKGLEAEAAERKRLAAIPWIYPFKDDNKEKWETTGGEWETNKWGTTTAKYEGDRSECVLAQFGEKNWKDMYVEMQFRLHKGKFSLGIRGGKQSGGSYRHDGVGLDASKLEADEDGWKKVRINVLGKELHWGEIPAEGEDLEDIDLHLLNVAKFPSGKFAFYVFKNTHMEIRNLRIKVLETSK